MGSSPPGQFSKSAYVSVTSTANVSSNTDEPERDSGSGSSSSTSSSSNSQTSYTSSSMTSTSNSPPSPPSPPRPETAHLPGGSNFESIQHAPHSSRTPRRSSTRSPSNGNGNGNGGNNGRHSTPTRRLGAIDEHSDSISPDEPIKGGVVNRSRLSGMSGHGKLFGLSFSGPMLPAFPTLARPNRNRKILPLDDMYDGMLGPRGEKFGDVRKNHRDAAYPERRRGCCGCVCGWKAWVCIVCAFLIIAIAVVIGTVIGLRSSKHSDQLVPDQSDGGSSGTVQLSSYPVGTWAIPSYLMADTPGCTPNAATWKCYPYSTFNTSANASYSTLSWVISGNQTAANAVPKYYITSGDTFFSYPFVDIPFNLTSSPPASNGAWEFTYYYTKTVVPWAALTADNVATRCYYTDVLLTGRLYNSTSTSTGGRVLNNTYDEGPNERAWPYALDFTETVAAPPECYKFINGQRGDRVDVGGTTTTAGGQCECAYASYL